MHRLHSRRANLLDHLVLAELARDALGRQHLPHQSLAAGLLHQEKPESLLLLHVHEADRKKGVGRLKLLARSRGEAHCGGWRL